jgi:hypothetical protein
LPWLAAEPDGSGGFRWEGRRFLPGDILISSQNYDADGLLAVCTEPRRYLSHCGFFVPLKVGDAWFPAVLEIHEKGLRAVPLAADLAPEKTAYAEIYRLKETPPSFHDRIIAAGARMLAENHPYELYMDPEDDEHLTCTRVGCRLFELSGVEPIATTTTLSGEALVSGRWLGLVSDCFLSPTDLVLSPRLHRVGEVDNGLFTRSVVRELVADRMGSLLRERALRPERLGLSFRLFERLITEIRSGRAVGHLLARASGFGPGEFPHGPPRMLAFARLMRAGGARAVRRIEPRVLGRLAEWRGAGTFSYREFSRDPGVIRAVNDGTTEISRWFE